MKLGVYKTWLRKRKVYSGVAPCLFVVTPQHHNHSPTRTNPVTPNHGVQRRSRSAVDTISSVTPESRSSLPWPLSLSLRAPARRSPLAHAHAMNAPSGWLIHQDRFFQPGQFQGQSHVHPSNSAASASEVNAQTKHHSHLKDNPEQMQYSTDGPAHDGKPTTESQNKPSERVSWMGCFCTS